MEPIRDVDDPRHVFLHSKDVLRRYGWGTTQGYENLKDRALIPAPLMTHPNLWRLDQLLAWEEKRIALAESASIEAFASAAPQFEGIAELLPQPKRRGRSA